MARLGVRDEAPLEWGWWGFGKSFIRKAILEEVAYHWPLNFSLSVKSRWLTALQEGQVSKDVFSDGIPLLAMFLVSPCRVSLLERCTVDE